MEISPPPDFTGVNLNPTQIDLRRIFLLQCRPEIPDGIVIYGQGGSGEL